MSLPSTDVDWETHLKNASTAAVASDADWLLTLIERDVGIPISKWPIPMQMAMWSKRRWGFYAGRYISISRRAAFIFLVHNRARPDVVVKWVHKSGRVRSDALHELASCLRTLVRGNRTQSVEDLRRPSRERPQAFERVSPSIPVEAHTCVAEVERYVRECGVARVSIVGDGDSTQTTCEVPFFEVRKAYFRKHFPWSDVVCLLNRANSPVHMREIAAGKTSPIGRARPMLDPSRLQWAAGVHATSLHVGVAHNQRDQEPLVGKDTPLRTEMCLEIDELPKALQWADDVLRWTWLRNALGVALRVLYDVCSVRHVLLFTSGNRGPHCWLLDEHVLEHTIERRRTFYDNLARPTDSSCTGVRDCVDFYKTVLLRPVDSGGFGLKECDPKRTLSQILQLTWPAFDEAVALDPRHLHRVPFSIHEKTMRVALPFLCVDQMPTRLEDAPLVTDEDLRAKLDAGLCVLRDVVRRLLDAGAILSTDRTVLATTVAEMPTASWATRAAQRKRTRDAVGKKVESTHSTVEMSPMCVDLEAASQWRQLLLAAAANPETKRETFCADMKMLALKTAGDDDRWRARFRHEASRLDVLIVHNATKLTNSVVPNSSGARLSSFHSEIGQTNFVKTIASCTRHRITNHSLLELDISGAHPSVAWGAVVAHLGVDEARRVCPNLFIVVTDRARAVGTLVKQSKNLDESTAKTRVLSALNQSEDDHYHHQRPRFVRELIEERRTMTSALLHFPPIAPYVDEIKEKSARSGKSTSLLSNLMQAAENALIERAVSDLRRIGWTTVGTMGDGILCDALVASSKTKEGCETARQCMVDAAGALGIDASVKIDHFPTAHSYM